MPIGKNMSGLNGAITTNTNIPTDYYGILKLDKNRRRCW